MIDHIQNVNTRQYDNFSKGKTSIKLFHPPGGESHIQLGWDYNEPEELDIKTKKTPKKPIYEPSFEMPQKEYIKSYHVNKYLKEEENDDSKIKKYKLQKKKSFSNEQQKISPKTKNNNTKKVLNEIKEIKEFEEEKTKNSNKKPNKDEDDLTKGGRVMVFNFCQ